jgi:hypothetical protein
MFIERPSGFRSCPAIEEIIRTIARIFRVNTARTSEHFGMKAVWIVVDTDREGCRKNRL